MRSFASKSTQPTAANILLSLKLKLHLFRCVVDLLHTNNPQQIEQVEFVLKLLQTRISHNVL